MSENVMADTAAALRDRREARHLLIASMANGMRLDAQVERAYGDPRTNSLDEAERHAAWEVTNVAEREVRLARAVTLELQADFLERFGIRAYQQDVLGGA